MQLCYGRGDFGAAHKALRDFIARFVPGYDAAGQQTLRLDARGNRTTYTFSTVGQITGRKYPDASRATFSYDAVGNRLVMASASGYRQTFTYDAVN
ncbi:MAG: hypothetical protein KDB03_24705 [Planctomycetales bacterium]|nr:hypothetical protein [Planctomycetales bacterium]